MEAAGAPLRVLMIDDDQKLCRLVRDYLAPHGFVVDLAHAGDVGLTRALEGAYDALILDVMLPGLDGVEVLRRLRQRSRVPVLMLTALGDETDRIVGLEMGADDYLPKTFSTRELLARLRAVTRRAGCAVGEGAGGLAASQALAPPPADPALRVGDLHIDPATRTVLQGDAPLSLTPIEFDLLYLLARAAGRVLTRDWLLEAVAGREHESCGRAIDVRVSSIRRKLGDDPRAPRYIRTVRAVGYLCERPGTAGERP